MNVVDILHLEHPVVGSWACVWLGLFVFYLWYVFRITLFSLLFKEEFAWKYGTSQLWSWSRHVVYFSNLVHIFVGQRYSIMVRNCHVWKDLIFLVLVQNASDSLVIPGCCRCVGHRALNQCDFFWLKTDCCGCPRLSQICWDLYIYFILAPQPLHLCRNVT